MPAVRQPSASAEQRMQERRSAVANHAGRLAVVLEALALLSLVSGAFPLALTTPRWWLRLGDGAVNLAPVLLMAVILLRFSSPYLRHNSDEARSLKTGTLQLASRWLIVYGLLVPLQLLGFCWLWLDSGNQLSAQINQATNQLAVVRTRLNGAASEAELQRLLAGLNPGLLPPPTPGPLLQQKGQLTEALDLSRSRLAANLSAQRTSMLINSIPGTVRVVLGAAIAWAFLLTIRRALL
jgi:hypothetical protein